MIRVALAACVRVGFFMVWDGPPDQDVIYPAAIADGFTITVLLDLKEGVWSLLP